MVKLCAGPSATSLKSPVTVEESRPPLKNAPRSAVGVPGDATGEAGAQDGHELLLHDCLRARAILGVGNAPIEGRLEASIAIERDELARQELAHLPVDRAGPRRVVEDQIVVNRRRIDAHLDLGMGCQGIGVGREDQPPGRVVAIEQRPHGGPVDGQQDPPLLPVDEGAGERALELTKEVASEAPVGLDQGGALPLSIGMRGQLRVDPTRPPVPGGPKGLVARQTAGRRRAGRHQTRAGPSKGLSKA